MPEVPAGRLIVTAALLPCDLADMIEKLFAEVGLSRSVTFRRSDKSRIGVLLRLVDQLDPGVPSSLPSTEQLELLQAIEDVRSAHASWQAGEGEPLLPRSRSDGTRVDPVTALRDGLRRCPDLSAAASPHALGFLGDAPRAALLRADLASVERLHALREWKAATVLAGSVLEALLLERVSRVDGTRLAAAVAEADRRAGATARRLTERSLRELATLARSLELDVPSRDTLIEIDKAGEFRNLIHPGLAERRFPARQSTATYTLAACYRFIEEWESAARTPAPG